MKTLFFTPKFHPEPNYYINDVVFDSSGINKAVLTGKILSFKNLKLTSYVNNVKIYYIPYIKRSNDRISRLILEYFSFFISSLIIIPIVLMLERPKKVFHYGISPPIYILPFLFLKPFFRFKIIYWVQDIWPESIFSRISHSDIFYSFIQFLMSLIYINSDKLILVSENFKENIRFKKYEEKIVCLPQGYKEESYISLDEQSSKIANLIKKESRRVIIYAGNISNSMYLEEMAEAIEENMSNFVFYIIGDGSIKNKLIKKNYKNVNFFSSIKRNYITQIVKLADFAYLGRELDRSNNTQILSKIIPGKLPLYLYCQVPIIAVTSEDLHRYIYNNNLGFVTTFSGVKNLSKYISSVSFESKEKIQSIKSSQRDLFIKMFKHKDILKKLEDIINL